MYMYITFQYFAVALLEGDVQMESCMFVLILQFQDVQSTDPIIVDLL